MNYLDRAIIKIDGKVIYLPNKNYNYEIPEKAKIYKVFKKHKDILDKMQCDLLRRIYLRNIYEKNSKHFLTVIDNKVESFRFEMLAYELNKEIWATINGNHIPLSIEVY